jgi:hypothetical protein
MFERYNRLIFIVLTSILLVIVMTCTQPDDVIAPVSETQLILRPDRLPTLPDGMVYYLWALDTASETNAYFIGNFIWKNEYFKFYDLDNNQIDSIWTADYDVLDPFYRYLCVSVERSGELPTGDVMSVDSIGPIMLLDTLVAPEEAVMKMVYPIDLWLGDGFFCVETPTDSNSNDHESGGIWFAEYLYQDYPMADTSGVRFFISQANPQLERPLYLVANDIDTTYFRCVQYSPNYPFPCIDSIVIDEATYNPSNNTHFIYFDTTDADSFVFLRPEGPEGPVDTVSVDTLRFFVDTVQIANVEIVTDSSYTVSDTLILDSFVHTYMSFDYVTLPINLTDSNLVDTITASIYDDDIDEWVDDTQIVTRPPLNDFNHTMVFDIYVSAYTVRVDRFLHSYEEVPDLENTKWHFKGWVVSPYLEPKSAFGELVLPAWNFFYADQELSPVDGGLITTGSFKSFRGPDDGNPYSDNHRVPPVPGEDFLLNLPAGVDSIYFTDQNNPTSNAGTVFITLEPDNYSDSLHNFPLVYMASRIPTDSAVTDTMPHTQFQSGDPMFNMSNKFSAVNDNSFGFPAIRVGILRK